MTKKHCTFYDFEIFVVPTIVDVINGLVFIIIYYAVYSATRLLVLYTVAKSGSLVDIKIEQ